MVVSVAVVNLFCAQFSFYLRNPSKKNVSQVTVIKYVSLITEYSTVEINFVSVQLTIRTTDSGKNSKDENRLY